MYVNVSKNPLATLLKIRTVSFDRSANGDFIFDLFDYTVRVNFSLRHWDQWYWDNGE